MDIKWMPAYIFMSMGTAKHEKEAIFQRKMCELRIFLRIVGARNAEQFGIKEVKIPFDLNII